MQSLVKHEQLNTWTQQAILDLFALPLTDLLLQAQTVHRQHHKANQVQVAQLLSIKTGACPEDCAYCSQSSHNNSQLKAEPLLALDAVLAAARKAKANGAQRFCMGAAWRSPSERQLDQVIEQVKAVKALGLETCVTLGMLKNGQAERLKQAGLDYYNHNIDTAPDYYAKIITTRSFEDRLDTLARARDAGLKLCCGGIVGLGETLAQRAGMILVLAQMVPAPESVPINLLIRQAGTPLADQAEPDPIEFVKTIAVARIVLPTTVVRLSAGREHMDVSTQALCFMAGANSIFVGAKLLTSGNPDLQADRQLFKSLGINVMQQ